MLVAAGCGTSTTLARTSRKVAFASVPYSYRPHGGGVSLSAPGPAQKVSEQYLNILDADMQSGNFANLSQIYTSDAVVTVSGGSFGRQPTVLRGIGSISRFLRKLRSKLGPAQWMQDTGQELAASVYLSYEHISLPSGLAASNRCAKVFSGACRFGASHSNQESTGSTIDRSLTAFTIRGDQVASVYWLVYA
jgi:hypothetical protein